MDLPIGPQVPRRGNICSRAFGRFLLWSLGWRLRGAVPDLPKMVLIGAPHTTNMDGVLALATLTALGLDASTMIKDSAFKGPLGILLRWMGAVPVNRKSAKGVVEQSQDAFATREKFLLLVAPEGTRHAAPAWKRGFYRIAEAAQVAVLPAACNYQSKVLHLGPPLYCSGDFDADFATLMAFYRDHSAPRYPQRLSKPLCEAKGQAWSGSED